MSYNMQSLRGRAEECVRLANLTKDDAIQRELLSLRQTYLKSAELLHGLEFLSPPQGNGAGK
jgi:hypothetical protein